MDVAFEDVRAWAKARRYRIHLLYAWCENPDESYILWGLLHSTAELVPTSMWAMKPQMPLAIP